MIKKSASALVGILLMATPLTASAQIADAQAQVALLRGQILALKGNSGPSSASQSQCVTLSHNLHRTSTDASTGGDVTRLQQFLGIAPTTGYFGRITLGALQHWQSSHDIVSSGTPQNTGYGSVGAKTRGRMACGTPALQGNTSTPITIPTPYTVPPSPPPTPISTPVSTTTPVPIYTAPAAVTSTYIKQHGLLVMEKVTANGFAVITVRADGTGETTLTGPDSSSPSWTPDGKIIFVSKRSGSVQIWIMDGGGTNLKQVGNLQMTGAIVKPQLARNGLIAFAVIGTNGIDPGSIWVMQKDGSGLKQLVKSGAAAPSLALSGTWLTYTAETNNPYHREIWRINTDGTGLQQLTFTGDADYPDANASSISPDETTVVFFSGTESPQGAAGFVTDFNSNFWKAYHNVAVVPAAGGARRNLTACKPVASQDAAMHLGPGECLSADNPAWSPDGKWVIYDSASSLGGTWMIDLNGQSAQQLYAATRGGGNVPMKYVN